ncbi:hypothetical protein NQZ79_g1910 [Umbelopsis isabellina]|nr:hypothetical protein NQZ79_g1910 [Umbelopsis isabellina]
MATEKTVEKSEEDSNVSNVLSSSVAGASYLILLQFASRMLTFALHQIVMRYTTAETLGIASVKLELLLSTILFLSREGFRCALLRGGSSTTAQPKKESKSRNQDNMINVNSPEGEVQKVTNLAYLPTAIGLVTTLTACIYYLSTIDDTTAAKYPFYRTSIVIYGLSAYCELLIEPLYIMALNNLYFKLRVSVEGVAVLLRCFLTFGLTVLGANGSETNRYGVLAFAIAQLAFVLALVMGYVGFFANKVRKGEINGKSIIPRKLVDTKDGRTFWFDRTLLDLSLTLTKQSMLKHVLTEGDKMLVSALSSDRDQGVYALVVNYGSLFARILFGPLEETSRTLFSKLLRDVGDKELTKSQSHALETSARILNTIFKLQILLGLIFICFATNYTATLIDLLVGSAWSQQTNAPTVLAFYCVYVPVMGINGISEAFVQAVASEQQLARLSKFMLLFSLVFVCSGVLFMYFMQLGAIGLVLANIVNLTSRIVYSWVFIRQYFTSKRGPAVAKITQIITLRNWLPSRIVLLVFASGWVITRMSEETIGWGTLKEKALHVAVGGIAALVAMGTM